MEPTKNYRKGIKNLLKIACLGLSIYYVVLFFEAGNLTKTNYFLLLFYAHLLTLCLLLGMVSLLSLFTSRGYFRHHAKYGTSRCLSNFLIGDEGGYSLSRVQMAVWAITILSYQLSVLLTLLLPHDAKGVEGYLFYYELDFSESALWLLGLSLVSYVSVKGITVEKLKKEPGRIPQKVYKQPEPIDIINGPNGLDFSKCQMAIWTLIAVFIFNSKVYEFNKALYQQAYAKNTAAVAEIFHHHYEEYSGNERLKEYDPLKPFVPYLPWAFIILMGVSHGAYVGKKLVPSFKVTEAANGVNTEMNNNLALLDIEIAAKQALLSAVKPITATGIETKRRLEIVIQGLLRQRAVLQQAQTDLLTSTAPV